MPRSLRSLVALLVVTSFASACSDPPKEEGPATPAETTPKETPDTAAAEPAAPTTIGEPAEMDAAAAGQRSFVAAFTGVEDTGWKDTAAAAEATPLAPEADIGSFTLTRRFLEAGELPPAEFVRTEAFINRFDYPYGDSSDALTLNFEVAPHPFNEGTHVVHFGLQGVKSAETPHNPVHLVLLIDDSPSMRSPEKLGMVTRALHDLTRFLNPEDRVTIATYGGVAQPLLLGQSTTGADLGPIRTTLSLLIDDDRSTQGALTGKFEGNGLIIAKGAIKKITDKDLAHQVVVISDGDHRLTGADHDAAIAAVQELYDAGAYVNILTVGTGELEAPKMAALALKGGGQHTYANSLEDVLKFFYARLEVPLAFIGRDFTAAVAWNPEVVKRYRLIGHKKVGDLDPERHDRGTYIKDHQFTLLYEVELAGEGELGELTIEYAGTQTADRTDRRFGLPFEGVRKEFSRALPHTRFATLAAVTGQLLAREETVDLKKLKSAVDDVASEIPDGQALLDIITLTQSLPAEALSELGVDEPQPKVASSTKKSGGDDGDDGPVVPGSKEDIAKVFKTKTKDIESCYKRVLQKSAAAGGDIAIKVSISSRGRVNSVRVLKDQIKGGMGKCVESKVKRWRFPAIGEPISVNKKWSL